MEINDLPDLYPIPKSKRNYNRYIDKDLKVCETCGAVWEVYNNKVHRYWDFPKIGKELETCPICENRQRKEVASVNEIKTKGDIER